MTKKDDKKKEVYIWSWLFNFGFKDKPNSWWK
jgi:hypothetical protein